MAAEERKTVGRMVNELKDDLGNRIEQMKARLDEAETASSLQREWQDITVPSGSRRTGTMHPISTIQYEIEDIFSSMGFMIMDGPWMEDDWHNFGALNIPADHPARDMQDTFWLSNGMLLRTHTSCVQIRAMEKYPPPLRVIAPGRVFRYEATDASHENTFYQVEGLMVDRDISVSHLIYTMKTLLRQVFGREVKVRLRPGFFPFVEPGFELDINCLICDGKGCPVCKQSGWVELLPCGLVHPNVLRHCKIDPDEFSGFAFGLGLNRLVMMRYGIDDIRYFQNPDLRFLNQF
ncbi:MAG: phenylalanine--tRNA ligase subunit alpha [Candidatus Wallbacteria bacterium]|nr:phenylalanine--tRNA ligase subunit alpha [Candidatus Wallbacteria bacterium]